MWHIVLPTARSGLVTAVILATARGIGETSPVLLTSGVTNVMNLNPFQGPMISLPLQVFDFVRSPEPNIVARGFGTAAVLMLLVLTLFAIARVLGGRGAGELSPRQRRSALARSQRDLARYEARNRAGATSVPSSEGTAMSPIKRGRTRLIAALGVLLIVVGAALPAHAASYEVITGHRVDLVAERARPVAPQCRVQLRHDRQLLGCRIVGRPP